MSKKNIDKLFQEKFKDFGEVPDEKVWESIEASLDLKKKSRRIVLPIWWKLGGAAAVLAILFYIINPFENNSGSNTIITDVENTEPTKAKKNDALVKDSLETSNENNGAVVISSEEGLDPGYSEDKNDELNPLNGQSSYTTNTKKDVFDTDNNKQENKYQQVNGNVGKGEAKLTGVAQEKNFEKGLDSNDKKKKALDVIAKEDTTGIANVDKIVKDKTDPVANVKNVEKELQAQTDIKKIPSKEGIAQVDIQEKEVKIEDTSAKKSIFDEIIEEDEAIAESDSNKWSVGTSVAPVYFNSFGEGSPIHSSFVSNSKSGNINLSYGLSVSYDVSKKLSIRSGIHKVDYGYDTNEISFSSSITASTNSQIDNIDYAITSENLVVQSNASEKETQDISLNRIESTAQDPSREGRMVQQFGYLEVPVELNYALVDRKLGVNIIGGVSSLFLVDNSVILESEGSAIEMGKANNINDINFSTNIGFGIHYKVSAKMQLNLEPMFKYQLNTFSDSAGDFRPFSVGVYSGLSFKF